MSKTIITSSGNSLKSLFDKRFGRAAWFCVYDETSGESVFYENNNVHVGHGAGIKTAEKTIDLGVGKVISGDFGPKAKELLEKFDVQMVIVQDDALTIQDIIEKLNSRN
jgi:predicted Fe-Mo cluster-binding NifX family protein